MPCAGPLQTEELKKNTFFVPTLNEALSIRKKIESLLNAEYPRDKLEIFIASDASVDDTHTIVESFANDGVILKIAENNLGKNSIINQLKLHPCPDFKSCIQ